MPTCEALEERINEEQLKILQHISGDGHFSVALFYSTAVANRDGSSGDAGTKLGLRAEYGIDYQLLQAAKQQHKPVIELEGAENQITMLLQLP